MNDLKLSALTAATQTKLDRKEVTTAGQQASTTSNPSFEADVTVSNQLGTMANNMVADNSMTDNSQRIHELKHMIETNQYKVDINGLADKLSKSMLIFNS